MEKKYSITVTDNEENSFVVVLYKYRDFRMLLDFLYDFDKYSNDEYDVLSDTTISNFLNSKRVAFEILSENEIFTIY